jgi:endonuclease/exonuclease/phosphatase family metal-dependent hydrolase
MSISILHPRRSTRRLPLGLWLILGVFVLILGKTVSAQNVGDNVRLESENSQGVPVHPAPGDASFVRWANGTTGKVQAIDQATGWLKVESLGNEGWVIKRYLRAIQDDLEPEDTAGNETLTYAVGTWNLEYFKDGASRGFPEYQNGGPRYGSRTRTDLQRIADIIGRQLQAKIMVLNEINGKKDAPESSELNELVDVLGSQWKYELAASGGSQRIAILYDTSSIQKKKCEELSIPANKVQGSDIFARDPLVCHFAFVDSNGQIKNDLLVVGLHLASGQDKVQNHNAAMEVLKQRLHDLQNTDPSLAGEKDILMGGDLNASRYDTKVENFWAAYDKGGFDFITLSPEDGELYPATRMAGVPLEPKSKIDYLIASKGLSKELVQSVASVHHEFAASGFDDFREHVSDHFPVTVRVRVVDDDD